MNNSSANRYSALDTCRNKTIHVSYEISWTRYISVTLI